MARLTKHDGGRLTGMSKWFLAGLSLCMCDGHAFGQAAPTALREADISIFSGITNTNTGLTNGKNTGVTGGVDLNLPGWTWVRPSIEARANVPFRDGEVDSQKSVLGGLRLEGRVQRFYPYVDFLAGAGKITFPRPYGLFSGQYLYSQPASIVLSPGAGLRLALTPHIEVFGDFQFQRWNTPASLSGHLFAKPATAGLVLRFGLPQHWTRR